LNEARMTESSPPEMYREACRLQAAGQLAEAERLFRRVLASEPYHPDALHFLGIVLTQTRRYAEAVDVLALGLMHRPQDASIAGDLGAALQLAARYEEAIAAYRHVLDLKPDLAAAWFNLGQSLYMLGRYAESATATGRAAELNPNDADIQHQIGLILRDSGDSTAALKAFERAIELRPNFSQAMTSMAALLHSNGHFSEAVATWRRALDFNPKDAAAAYNLGSALRHAGRVDDAIAALRQSVAANPNEPMAWNNLAGLLKDIGELGESLGCYDRAIALRPDSAPQYSNRLYTIHFHPAFDAKKILSEHLEYARRFLSAIRPDERHENDRDENRPLRIGYVSADFRRHPVGLSFEFLLENHDRKNFQTVCFSNVRNADKETERMRRLPEEWHEAHSLSDDQLVALVRERKIDILVDLSLHMAHNRLTMFARKPAPVQVTYLGYPSTTGVGAIEYRLSDSFIDPPGTDGNYTEKTVRLPRTYMCWRWGGEEAAVNDLPAKGAGVVTFGSLNNYCKVTPEVLTLWGEVMGRVKNSRLILRCPAQEAARKVIQALTGYGIAAERVRIVGHLSWKDYVDLYHQQDIGLDPSPYPGHTTSLDSYWMGVPVVTLTGDTGVSRVGTSLLSTIGLPELIAPNRERYVAIVSELAGDLSGLAELRSGLRERVRGSAICDGRAFARDVEGVYRKMWRDWVRR
jgi:protein O-GlcNAc transferase